MAKRQHQETSKDKTAELLKDLMIIQLGLARVPQQKIREIVGVNINRVNRIVKHLSSKKPKE
jgi:transposase-like protein